MTLFQSLSFVVNLSVIRKNLICAGILGSHSSGCKDYCYLECDET